MPLTSVVAYFNRHLESFSPASRLRHEAGIHYDPQQGERALSAHLDHLVLVPDLRAITTLAGNIIGWEGALSIHDRHARPVRREALYRHVRDDEDIVFIDRFLRVLHALHYLHCLATPPLDVVPDQARWQLMLDVHWRHLRAVHEAHGEVFEALLQRLGLSTGQVVLRLQASTLIDDAHAHAAARSFAARGYTLLVDHLSIEAPCWALMNALGVHWVSPEVNAWRTREPARWVHHDQWISEAHRHGLKVLLRRAPEGREGLITRADALLEAPPEETLTATALPGQAPGG
ncbi:hypothetical protein [Kushneria phyllosphaerae]|uniref:Uncharacterized protein n=1 Tax=Kushneria phyllosphaerae TaxID=2100822 RepID=A0A2R8CJ30_9GAMM|nr:hypothetical protein [Kushneria phyllosphaerae]SPJ32917.1 hypothetical protein KSP9073_00919 [Kushneria phyllosphaerae]